MKVTLVVCFFVVAALFESVYSESCSGTDTSSCNLTSCDSSTTLACTNGLCTCVTSSSHSCSTRQDCLDLGDTYDCPRILRHCVDGLCSCGSS